MNRSPILRRFARKLAARANRFDNAACNAGLDSAAVIVIRADVRTRRIARRAGLDRHCEPHGIFLRPMSAYSAGAVGPGTGKSGKRCHG